MLILPPHPDAEPNPDAKLDDAEPKPHSVPNPNVYPDAEPVLYPDAKPNAKTQRLAKLRRQEKRRQTTMPSTADQRRARRRQTLTPRQKSTPSKTNLTLTLRPTHHQKPSTILIPIPLPDKQH